MKKIMFLSLCLMNYPVIAKENKTSWLDHQHAFLKHTLHNWSNNIDNWIGTPDPNKPASANLRIMFDNEWNHYDGYSIKPRIRGKIKLPALKKRFSLMFGDDDLDNQASDKQQLHRNYRETLKDGKRYDQQQTRSDNTSLSLRWSDNLKALDIKTDLDLGIRAGTDLYLRAKMSKKWEYDEIYSTRLEQIYRYGINSKHYFRINLENTLTENSKRSINSHTFLQYTHKTDEEILWGNSFFRQHHFSGYKQLNYGFLIAGMLDKKTSSLNTYGPFINWRQPILREWLFIQSEVHFYNNVKAKRKHHLGTFLRLEAIF